MDGGLHTQKTEGKRLGSWNAPGASAQIRLGAALAVAAIAVAAAVLSHGIRSHLPAVYDMDEIDFVTMSTRMIRNHDANPHWFGHPGTTLLYLMPAVWGVVYVVGHALGRYRDVASFQASYFSDVTPFYEAGRFIVATAALAALALTFAITRRLSGPLTAAFATIILACSPLLLTYAALVRTDVMMTAFVLAATLAALSIMNNSSWRASLLAGAFAALAFDTKYPAIMVFLTIGLAHWWSDKTSRIRRWTACLAAFATVSFFASPFLYLDFHEVFRSLAVEGRPAALGGTGEGLLRNLAWYIRDVLSFGVGDVVLVAAAVGILISLRGPRSIRLLIPYPIVTLIFISALPLRWERWAVTLLPWAAIFAALGFTWGLRAVSARAARSAIAATVVIVALLPTLASSAKLVADWDASDPRTVAETWMESHLAKGSRIYLEPMVCEMRRDEFRYYAVSEDGQLRAVDQGSVRHPFYVPLGGSLAQLKNADSLARQRVQYVVASEQLVSSYEAVPAYARLAQRERLVISKLTLLHAWPARSRRKHGVALYRL